MPVWAGYAGKPIDALIESMSYYSTQFEKRLSQTSLREEIPTKLMAKINDKLQVYADYWQVLINSDLTHNEALEILNYFIDCALQSKVIDELTHPIKNLDDLAIFLMKVTKLTKPTEEEMLRFLSGKMGSSVFDLIGAHFKNEQSPAGRENSIVAAIISQLVQTNTELEAFILKSIEPLLNTMINTADSALIKADFSTAVIQLFTSSNYPDAIQRIVYEFSLENPDQWLAYLSTRIINPVISKLIVQHNDTDLLMSQLLKTIMFALQGLHASNFKLDSYRQNIANDIIFELVFNGVLQKRLNENKPSQIQQQELKIASTNFDMTPTLVKNIKRLNAQYDYLRFEISLISMAQQIQLKSKTVLWDKYKEVYTLATFEQKVKLFNQCLTEIKELLSERIEIKESKIKILEEIDECKTWLLFLCHCTINLDHHKTPKQFFLNLYEEIESNLEGLIRTALFELETNTQKGGGSLIKFNELHYSLLKEKMSLSIYKSVNQEIILKDLIKKTCRAILEKFEDTQIVSLIEIDDKHIPLWRELNEGFKKFIEVHWELNLTEYKFNCNFWANNCQSIENTESHTNLNKSTFI
ncbi:MAG: hypothetical protein H0U70_05660 [Tatlockia sp.]|nr:hypothetical protein [Tatlockia sp.]